MSDESRIAWLEAEVKRVRELLVAAPGPPSADGVAWPLTVYICQHCARPTLWREDRCCGGLVDAVKVTPVGKGRHG